LSTSPDAEGLRDPELCLLGWPAELEASVEVDGSLRLSEEVDAPSSGWARVSEDAFGREARPRVSDENKPCFEDG
jgi:hypothetical protein